MLRKRQTTLDVIQFANTNSSEKCATYIFAGATEKIRHNSWQFKQTVHSLYLKGVPWGDRQVLRLSAKQIRQLTEAVMSSICLKTVLCVQHSRLSFKDEKFSVSAKIQNRTGERKRYELWKFKEEIEEAEEVGRTCV